MKHRGKILEKAILKSQLKKTTIAKMLGISTRYVYDLVEKESIPNDDMIRYGKALGYDFSFDIPELVEYQMIKEPEGSNITNAQYREKYFELLEKHIKIIEENDILKKISIKKAAPSVPSAPKLRQKKEVK